MKNAHVVIVGGGASGAIALIRAIEMLPGDTRFTIIEPRSSLGIGRAYATSETHHLLNVPSDRMSIFPKKSKDFVEWLNSHSPSLPGAEGPYVPRKYFADYLSTRLGSIPADRFTHHVGKVRTFQRRNSTWQVITTEGQSFTADAVIIATGYENSVDPGLLKPTDPEVNSRIVQAYDFEKLNQIQKNDRVLVIGTGLTAIDVFLHLNQHGVQEIQMLSRRGLSPIPHPAAHPHGEIKIPPLGGLSPLQILRIFKSFLRVKENELLHLVQEIRTQATSIWNGWTPVEKKQFIQHLKPYWEIIRHRVPQSVSTEMNRALQEQRLKRFAGCVLETQKNGSHLEVTFKPRRESSSKKIVIDWIVMAADAKIDQSLHSPVAGSGLSKCKFGFGYTSETAEKLWLVGPAAKAYHWESTAIPDITKQVEQTIREISNHLQANHKTSRFHDHPHAIGETYFQHLGTASGFALTLVKDAAILMIHAVLPFLYTERVSNHLFHFSKMLTRRKMLSIRQKSAQQAATTVKSEPHKKAA